MKQWIADLVTKAGALVHTPLDTIRTALSGPREFVVAALAIAVGIDVYTGLKSGIIREAFSLIGSLLTIIREATGSANGWAFCVVTGLIVFGVVGLASVMKKP